MFPSHDHWGRAILLLESFILTNLAPLEDSEGKLPKFPLMGSSVQFDRRWLQRHAKHIMKYFNYRNMDASSIYEMLKLAPDEINKTVDKLIDKEKEKIEGVDHTALYDIRKSLAYWRVYSKVFNSSINQNFNLS